MTNGAAGNFPISPLFSFMWPWKESKWIPKDGKGEEVFAPGNYEATVGWKDVSILGGGETKRIFGYSTKITFDWDGWFLDRVGRIFGSSSGRGVNPILGTGFKKLSKAGMAGSVISGAISGVTMFTGGLDGDANLVFASRFDYQYFGSKYFLTRHCKPTEINTTNLGKGIAFSYSLLALYFVLTAFAQVMIRVRNKVQLTDENADKLAEISNSILQPAVADGGILGILKWWDERCVLLTEILKEYDYLKIKIELIQSTIDNIAKNAIKYTTDAALQSNTHRDGPVKFLGSMKTLAQSVYAEQLIKSAVTKSTTAISDYNAKTFFKEKKLP